MNALVFTHDEFRFSFRKNEAGQGEIIIDKPGISCSIACLNQAALIQLRDALTIVIDSNARLVG